MSPIRGTKCPTGAFYLMIKNTANGQVEFKNGIMHVMYMMMKADQFKTGSKVDRVMTFEMSDEKTVSVDIRDQ